MSSTKDVLLEALPPATDYLTYLTIIEYNLTKENLPTLQKVLQDETLAINIGWDLIHILIPLLPESKDALYTIARLGNPREVILKVVEKLRLIAIEDEFGTEDAQTTSEERVEQNKDSVDQPVVSSHITRFQLLINLLTILHQRIKTRYPSRFLSSTLQAILVAFGSSISDREDIIFSVIGFVKSLNKNGRPALPTRKSSTQVLQSANHDAKLATDPEASQGEQIGTEETALQLKLQQSFVTHVAEEYMLNVIDYKDMPGFAWCSRVMEKTQPARAFPTANAVSSLFDSDPILQKRLEALGGLLGLAKDLRISDDDLIQATSSIDERDEPVPGEDDPPNSAKDIPLSRLGSMLLYTARQVSHVLYDIPDSQMRESFEIFPGHQAMLGNCLSSPTLGASQLGQEPSALIDAAVVLGLICLEKNHIGIPQSDEKFNEYLQSTALLSSNCPDPNLRGHAHYLTTTVLRSHPDDSVRLAFIRDTLEHCPFENLKVSAVSWIKGATIEANALRAVQSPTTSTRIPEGTTSIFAKPYALDSLAPYLFPSLRTDLITAPINDAWLTWQTNVAFYLASLNFLYLLLHVPHLYKALDIKDLWINTDIPGSFLRPLRDTRIMFGKELEEHGRLTHEKSDAVLAELILVEETLARVTAASTLLSHDE